MDDDDQFNIVPVCPDKVIVGGVVPLHIVAVPAVIVAVPATVVGSTTTVTASEISDEQFPLDTIALYFAVVVLSIDV